MIAHTFVRHHLTCLKVHPGAPGCSDLVDVVAQLVAAVFAAAEAQALVKGFFRATAVSQALLILIHQRVDEQVHRTLVRTFHQLVHVC